MGLSGHQTVRRKKLGDRQTEAQGNCGAGRFLGKGRGSMERYCDEGRCLYFHQAKEESHAAMMGDTPGYCEVAVGISARPELSSRSTDGCSVRCRY